MQTLKRIFQVIMVLTGFALMANAIFMIAVSNFNTGPILACAAGIFLLLVGRFWSQIVEYTRSGVLRYMRYVVLAGLIFIIGLVGFLAIYGHNDTASNDEEVIIVLGGGIRGETVTLPLQYRLDTAIAYAQENPDALIVVTGGQGLQEDISEALAMERYLVQRGIPADKIIKEENSTNTYENFVFSKQILDERLEEPYRVVVITNHFHIYRASRLAKIAGFSATHLHATLQSYALPANYLRETLAVFKLWIFNR